MRPHGVRDGPQGTQCSAFSRMLEARRSSEAEKRRGDGDLLTPASPSGCPPLPDIRQQPPSFAIASARRAAPDAASAVHRASSQGHASTPQPSLSSYVITDKTPRAELLVIISQLQVDLTQRTDSVNAIQRNFERLSAMHHAEQLELQRLRQVEKSLAEHDGRQEEKKLREAIESAVTLQSKVREHEVARRRLEAQVQATIAAREREREIGRLVAAHAAALRALADEESEAFAQLHRAAGAESTSVALQRGAATAAAAQTQLCRDTAEAVVAHHAQVIAMLVHDSAHGVAPQLPPHKLPLSVTPASLLDELQPWIAETEEAVRQYVAAARAVSERQRAAGNSSNHARDADLQRVGAELRRCKLTAVTDEERTSRQALLFGERSARGLLQRLTRAWRGAVERQGGLHTTSSAAQAAVVEAQLSQRLASWCTAADVRFEAMDKHLAALRAHGAELEDSDRQRTAQQLLESHAAQLQAVRDEAAAQLSAAHVAHARELAQRHQEWEMRLRAADLKAAAAQRQCDAHVVTLAELERLHAEAMDAATTAWQTATATALSQREASLCAEFRRAEAAQQAHLHAVAATWADALQARERCASDERSERLELVRARWLARTQQQQRVHAAEVARQAHAAALREGAARLGQEEASTRAQWTAEAATAWGALARDAAASLAAVQHAAAMRAAAMEASAARAVAAAQEAWRALLSTMDGDLQRACEERLAAVTRAADAVAAAQKAAEALQTVKSDFASYKTGVSAAAQRIEVAESATESACCCALCLQLYTQPVACVPCGHAYCAGCLLQHPRNRGLSRLTAAAAAAAPSSRGELDVTQWLGEITSPHARLYCPECGTAAGTTVVELQMLGELTAKFDYKKRSLAVLLAELQ